MTVEDRNGRNLRARQKRVRDEKGDPQGSLHRLRIATGVVLIALVVLVVLADAFAGAFGVRSDFRAGPVILGTLIGALLLTVGIEIGSRFPWGNGK